MFLLPVPERPQTNQLSSISTSPIGNRKNAPSCGGEAPCGVMKAPSLIQLEWSQPLANDHLPLST